MIYRARKVPEGFVAERLSDSGEVLDQIVSTHLPSLQMIAKRTWWPMAADADEKQAITRAFTGEDNCEGCGG